jgi:membrane protein DedA with SNARE-associated domain
VVEHLLKTYGYVAIFVVIALENVGLPVPGETILITSAIFAASTHELNVYAIVATAIAAGIGGSIGGFAIGRYSEQHFLHRFGPYVHIGEDDLRLGQYLFRRFGGRVVFIARYIAVLRSLASLLAGANRMEWHRFLLFTSLGAAAWAATFGFGAYALDQRIAELSRRATIPIVIVIVVLAIAGLRFIRHNRDRLQREADRAMLHSTLPIHSPRPPERGAR